VAEIEAFDWPDPTAPGLIADDARTKAKAIYEAQRYMTALEVSPLFHQYHYLRGFEQWMIDIKLNRDVHQAIADHIHDVNTTLLMRLLEAVGPYTDLVITYDDFGTSTASYMSPQDFRTLIKPYYRDLIRRIKGQFPHLKFYLHSHGQIMALVPDLIECGVDVLNPILPLDNMDPMQLKHEFGDDLCFHGGIDVEHVLPFGSLAEVRDHVRRVIDILAPGGGFWFKAQAISPVIPPENVIGAYEFALEYGQY
jgi:uroporphyrinogen decarboxylase